MLCYALAQKKRKNSNTLMQVFFVLKDCYMFICFVYVFFERKRGGVESAWEIFSFSRRFFYLPRCVYSQHMLLIRVSLSLSLSLYVFFLFVAVVVRNKVVLPFTAITLNLIYSRKISEAPLRRSRRTYPRFFARARTFPFSYRTPWRVKFSRRESRCERGFYPP